jgi:hypothetical protein
VQERQGEEDKVACGYDTTGNEMPTMLSRNDVGE